MPESAVRILVVGPLTEATREMSQRLERHGWATHAVASMREAKIVLNTIRLPLVLAAEHLEDGTGYELMYAALRQELTLMVGLQLTETLLWLPVVEGGERSLGRRALNPVMLESEIERMLREMDEASAAVARERTYLSGSSGPVLREGSGIGAGRRKGSSDSKTAMPPMRGLRKAAPAMLAVRAIDTATDGKH
jgi:CheY-like chemotaxis protein